LSLTVLDGSTFCVCDERGDVDGLATASGFFASDTRFLSRSVLTLAGERLDPLSHDHSMPQLASFVLRNPLAGGLQPNELVVKRERFVGDCMEERIVVENHSHRRVDVELGLELAADFADIFVVKSLEPGFGRPGGEALPLSHPPERAADGTIVFSDGSFRGRTIVHLSEELCEESDGVARFALSLEPKAEWRLVVGVQPELEDLEPLPASSFARELDEERRRAARSMNQWQDSAPVLRAGWDDLVHTWNRSLADLASLRMRVPEVAGGELLAAGTPWFMTVFGRDTLISSLQTLLLGPELAAGTLRVLAATQSTFDDAERDAEPGKIIHELRRGKAALAWTDRYYGTVDATPLFLVLLSELWRWTDDPTLPIELEDAARRAVAWIDSADLDGDGFIEYDRRSSHGIRNQTWKDSEDSMAFHDGTLADAPIAPVEVQGYVYDAKLRMAEIAREVWKDEPLAERLETEARELRRRFDDAFWLGERGFYALGLDRDKRPIDSLTSNVGHLFWSGIVPAARRDAVADLLMGAGLWSGWGVRTMAVGEGAYNPLVYHDGTVWPHDNSLVAWGLARSARSHDAARILQAMVEAAAHFDYRLPEVFAGFARQETSFPVVYPTASSPQAWAAATPVLLMQVVLDLVPDRGERVLRSDAQSVPEWLEGLSLEGVHAFGRRWTVRVERGAVDVEPTADD